MNWVKNGTLRLAKIGITPCLKSKNARKNKKRERKLAKIGVIY